MISILIPIFNWDIRPLVRELRNQSLALRIPFEIICLDDASAEAYTLKNRELLSFPEIRYEELPQNIGRSAIRNRLASLARFPFLLFMDADSGIVRPNYIESYLAALSENTVLVGGTCYQPMPPGNPDFLLRWRYGVRREQRPLEKRRKAPWESFLTHHFVIPRALFQEIRFEEKLRSYGHEDTLFGLALQKAGTRIRHLDNPLEHLGLEPAAVFLQKVESSIRNLVFLKKEGQAVRTKVQTLCSLLSRLGLGLLFARLFVLLKPWMYRQLLGPRPKLWVLDACKLGWLCALMQEKKAI